MQPGDKAPLVLALRKWHKLSPDRELRCFVKDNKLKGSNFPPFFKSKGNQ